MQNVEQRKGQGLLSRRRVCRVSRGVAAVAAASTVTALGLIRPAEVRADLDTFTGGSATSPTWDQNSNWTLSAGGNAKPGIGDDALFPTPIPTVPGASISLGAGETANSLTFNANYTLATSAAGVGDLTLGNVLPTATNTNATTITLNPGVTATLNVVLKGTNGISVGVTSGTGIVSLGATNTFSGGLTINTGAIVSFTNGTDAPTNGTGAALGTSGSGVILNGGTLRYSGVGTFTGATNRVYTFGSNGGTIDLNVAQKYQISGAGGLSGSGTFTRTASANNTTANNLSITGANTGFTGAVILNGGETEVSGNGLGNGSNANNTITINAGAELINNNNTLANSVFINGGTLSGDNGTATYTGSVVANANFTIRLGDFYQAVNRNLNINGPLSGTGSISFTNGAGATVAGQTLFLNGNNSGYTSNLNIPSGYNVAFGSTNSLLSGTVTVNTSATALGGIGINFNPGTAGSILPFTNARATNATGGVFGINANVTTPIDLSALGGGGMFLGSQGNGTYSASTLNANGTSYLLGGGGGTLTLATPVLIDNNGTATSVIVNDPRINGSATVNLGSLANTFSGSVQVNSGILIVNTLASGGSASPIGSGTSAVVIGSTSAATFRYAGTASATTNRDFVIGGTGGGIFDVTGTNVTVTIDRISGASNTPFSKIGPGILRVSGATASTLGNVLIGSPSTSATVSTLTLAPALTTIAGNLTIAENGSNGTLVVPTGGSLSVGSGASNVLDIGTHNVTTVEGQIGVLDATAANSLVVNVGTIRAEVDYSSTTGVNGPQTATIRLPTLASSTNLISASTGILLGDNGTEGGNGTVLFNFGGGSTTISTPLFQIGARKTSALVNVNSGASVIIGSGVNATGRTSLQVGLNNIVGTGTAPTTTADFTGGALTANFGQVIVGQRIGAGSGANPGSVVGLLNTGTSAATVINALATSGSTLTIGYYDPTGSAAAQTNAAAAAIGTFIFGGGTGTIADTASGTAAVVVAQLAGSNVNIPTVSNQANGTFTVNGGALTITPASGAPAISLSLVSTNITGTAFRANATMNVGGGTLTLNGDIATGTTTNTNVARTTLNLTGGVLDLKGHNIGNLSTFNFTGGTLQNLGTYAQAVTQNGSNSLLNVLATNTTLSSNYTLTSGSAQAAVGRTLAVGGNAVFGTNSAFATTISNTSGAAAGLLAVTGTLDLTTTGDTLIVSDPTGGTAFDGTSVYTLATFASLPSNGRFDTVDYFNGSSTLVGTDAQAEASGGLFPNGYELQYNGTSLQLASVPEPTSLGIFVVAAGGLLSRRRRKRDDKPRPGRRPGQ